MAATPTPSAKAIVAVKGQPCTSGQKDPTNKLNCAKNKAGKFVWSEIVAKKGQPCTEGQTDPKNAFKCVKNEAGKFVWGEKAQLPPPPPPLTSETTTAGNK